MCACNNVSSMVLDLSIRCIGIRRDLPAKMLKQSVLLLTATVMAAAHHERTLPFRAIAHITSPSGQDVQGNVTFTQRTDGKVHVDGSIFGLAPGQYGFHVHEKGDITGGCGTTGSHYNPEHKDHGHPSDENRHVGDLGNVVFDENRSSTLNFDDALISLIGPHCIIGRAVVLHEKADDFGKSDHPDSRKTGNAGGRVACGVIGILDPVDGWNSASSPAVASVILLLTALLFWIQ